MNALAAVGLASALAAGAGTWFLTDTIKDAEIATIKSEYAESNRKAALDAINQLEKQVKSVNEAAQLANRGVADTNKKLDEIGKGLNKNAKPLPTDCQPDAGRMQSLTDAVDAVNAATARHGTGR